MEFFRAIWPSQGDIESSMIDPTRHALWEQRAFGVFLLVGSVALYGSLACHLASFLMALS